MKKLTCRDLGGPCDAEFVGDPFDDIGKQSRAHVMEQMQKGDQAQVDAANHMRMATPEQQKALTTRFRKRFDQAQRQIPKIRLDLWILSEAFQHGTLRGRGNVDAPARLHICG